MLSNNYDIQAIQKYLNKELSNDERYAFEKKMEADPFLKDAVDGFENIDTNEISGILKNLNEDIKTYNKTKHPAIWLKIAASALLIIGISSLLYINTFAPDQNQLSLKTPKKEQLNYNYTKPLSPYLPELIIQDTLSSNLIEINTNNRITENKITVPPKLKSKTIITSEPMPPNNRLDIIEDHIISSSGEISGNKIQAFSNSERNRKLAVINGQKVPLNDIIDIDSDDNNFKSKIPHTAHNSYNYKTLSKSNSTIQKSYNNSGYAASNNSYYPKNNDSINTQSNITESSKTNSPLIFHAKIGDEKFIKRVKRKVKFPFDSISASEIILEVLIHINANGSTKGIVIKEDLPQSFIDDLEKAIKETTKWNVPTKNNKPIGGTRKIFLLFKYD